MQFIKSLLGIVILVSPLAADESTRQVLLDGMHHLRVGDVREWSEFPEKAESDRLVLKFAAKPSDTAQTLRLRQQDIKQTWQISLNGTQLGRLPRDENDMVVYYNIPGKLLKESGNVLKIEQIGRQTADDIRVGEITLDSRSQDIVLNEGRVSVRVLNSDTKQAIPCRITVVNKQGTLVSVGANSNATMAVRPGIIYCSGGQAVFGLPAGEYTVFAGRGFEWGLDSHSFQIKTGDKAQVLLSIRREVPTAGFVSCDTHVHTLTHSGHGDATIEERMLTIAGEGIELPIATDHNLHIDFGPLARKLGVRKYFTPVIGNEVTTKVGHFNVFPVKAGSPVPDFRLTDWAKIFDSIYSTPGVRAVILNHARDVHGGVTPHGPKLHNAVIGQNLEGWKQRANGIELINSGATQTDPMRLYHDWFGLLNRGLMITPVGSSDSHDVGRHFVGQGRTYLKCPDDDPGNIDVDVAVSSFVAGRVMVSYGLLAEIKVGRNGGPGDLVSVEDKVDVAVRVLGPSWSTADTVALYMNGKKIREARITDGAKAGVKWSGHWTIRSPKHDVHLVAVARGPGIKQLYWATAKSYQPTSPIWNSYVIGSSGAVWLDADRDGKRSSAFDYAERLVKTSEFRVVPLLKALGNYDEAVAAQAAAMIDEKGVKLTDPRVRAQLKTATDAVQRGFQAYLTARRECQIARSAG